MLSQPPIKEVVDCLPVACDLPITTNLIDIQTPGWDDFDFAANLSLTIPDDPAGSAPDGQGIVHVSMNLPDVRVTADSQGYCCDDFCCLWAIKCLATCCWISLDVHVQTIITLTGANGGWKMEFDLTEAQLEGCKDPVERATCKTNSPASCCPPNAEVKIIPPEGEIPHEFPIDDISIGGVIVLVAIIIIAIVGAVLTALTGIPVFAVALSPLSGFLAVLIFNAIDKAELFFDSDMIAEGIASAGPSIPFDGLEFCFTEDIDQLMLKTETNLEELEVVTDQGVNVQLKGKVAPTSQDPCAADSQGFVLSCADPPLFPQDAVTKNAYAVLSDDIINQMMEATRMTGSLPISNYIPPITLGGLPGIGTCIVCPAPPPACCGSLFACHGMNANTGILFEISPDTAPTLVLMDNPATPQVEVQIRLNSVSATVIADRDSDGIIGVPTPGNPCPAATLPVCAPTGPTIPLTCPMGPNGDCRLYEACYNLFVNVTLDVQETMIDGVRVPQITFTNASLNGAVAASGAVCNGSLGSFNALAGPVANVALNQMIANFPTSFPPFTLDGLSLDVNACEVGPQVNPGGLLSGFGCVSDDECESGDCLPLMQIHMPQMIAIESNADPTQQDYIGIELQMVTCAGVSCDAGQSCNPQTGACEPN